MEKAQLTIDDRPVAGECDAVEIVKDYLQGGLKESEIVRKLMASGFQEERVCTIMLQARRALYLEQSQRDQYYLNFLMRF